MYLVNRAPGKRGCVCLCVRMCGHVSEASGRESRRHRAQGIVNFSLFVPSKNIVCACVG